MNEALLHYIWKYKLYQADALITTSGDTVEVIHQGQHNSNAGPDFLDARLRIDNTLWAGNVELHIKSSDWHRHGHQHDKAYNNVLLQVVDVADADAMRENGELVPNLVIKFPEHYRDNYSKLLNGQTWVACESFLPIIDPLTKRFWFEKLAVQRMDNKAAALKQLLTQQAGDWGEAFYQFVAIAFGFSVNAQAFEMLARALPQAIIAKHKDSQLQIEALLFGQAGFLEGEALDDYHAGLQQEYRFLQKKYQLRPIEKYLWKYLRLRPVNFPSLRIAQFAALLFNSKHLFAKVLDSNSLKQLQPLFACEPNEYWRTHYQFGTISKARSKPMGKNSVQLLLINAVVPMLMLYGREMSDSKLLKQALLLLEQLPAEKNSILREWKRLGFWADNAYDSQALIELKKNYCNKQACLDCAFGHKIMSAR